MKNKNNIYLVFAIVLLVGMIPAIVWSVSKYYRLELIKEITPLESVTTTEEETEFTVIEITTTTPETTATESSVEKTTETTTEIKTTIIPETATTENETTHKEFKKLTLPTLTLKHITTTEEYKITPAEFRRAGVVYYNGYKFTYYSEKVLPGPGLRIPGRHSDGNFVRDENNYICVASSDLPKGTIVDTPFGKGKVYDTGCPSGVIDIYVSW